MLRGGQISEGGAIFPRKYGPGGSNFGGWGKSPGHRPVCLSRHQLLAIHDCYVIQKLIYLHGSYVKRTDEC